MTELINAIREHNLIDFFSGLFEDSVIRSRETANGVIKIEIVERGFYFSEIEKGIIEHYLKNSKGYELLSFEDYEKDIDDDRIWWACVKLKRLEK